MKKVYVCASFRFLNETESLELELERNNIEHEMPKKDRQPRNSELSGKNDKSDQAYIVGPERYIGKSKSADIGHPYATNKSTYAMCPPDESSLKDSIIDVLSPKALIDLLKKDSHTKLLKARSTNPTKDSHDE